MFNLINILGQNTLPEQVEINKQNIAILADEVEKLGYQPKGVYDAETEYNHNDVVFYDNKLYVVTSDAAIVGVLPTNTTYWQQVTGDIRGQQGATGAQGPAGADGTDGVDGKPVLWYNLNELLPNQAAFNTLLTESSHDFTKGYFSRVGDFGDEFIYFVNILDSNTSFALIYKIVAWPEGINYCTAVRQNVYASMTGRKGDTGATGKEALVYGETIPFSRGESSTQLIEQNLPFANFNRTPELNEDFIAILHDTLTLKDYIANVEVQTINSGSQVVSACVASNIALITGANGQNGTNGTDGTDGKDALTTIKILTTGVEPAISQTKTLSASYFNRTPDNNEVCPIIIVYNSTRTYQAMIRVLSNTNYTCEIIDVVETTGAAGATPTLYQQQLYFSQAAGQKYYFVCSVITTKSTLLTFDEFKNYVGIDSYTAVSGKMETSSGSNTYNPALYVSKTSANTIRVTDINGSTINVGSTSLSQYSCINQIV